MDCMESLNLRTFNMPLEKIEEIKKVSKQAKAAPTSNRRFGDWRMPPNKDKFDLLVNETQKIEKTEKVELTENRKINTNKTSLMDEVRNLDSVSMRCIRQHLLMHDCPGA